MKLFITFSICVSSLIMGFSQSNLENIVIQRDTAQLQSFFETTEDINGLHIQSEYTCLNFAVKADRIEIVKWLLEHEANPNVISNGKSALMYAAKYGRLEIAKLLIKNGADVNLQNTKGRSALDYAKKY
ncbi:MAG: ankyrin repeat domain-containing protein, partial [Bacteroidota bacterium]